MKNMSWLSPAYYKEFHCKADKCRNSCCSNWRIPVSKAEYYRLITIECSEDLNRCIQNTFIMPETVTDSCYRYISFNWQGICPLQEKGLCNLHREKGEKYLPEVCRLYPRSLKQINDIGIASCSSSCERVAEMLLEANSLKIGEAAISEEAKIFYVIEEEDIRRMMVFDDILKRNDEDLCDKIAKICRIINKDEFEKDYEAAEDPLIVTVNLLSRFMDSNAILDEVISTAISRYKDDVKQFKIDSEAFEENYPDWMPFFERVINNSLIYECFPFVDKKADQTKVYKGLCAAYGLLRLVCIAGTVEDRSKERLVDVVASLFHLIDHTSFYYNISCIIDNTAVILKL